MKTYAILAALAAVAPVVGAGAAGAQIHRDRVVVTHRTVTHRVVHQPVYHRPVVHRSQHCAYRWVNHHRVRRCWYG